jgi:predicted TIM-barrel fold metal-dependent hydrolase
MPDFRPYIPARYHAEFDDFCVGFARDGCRTIDPKSLLQRIDPYLVDEWVQSVVEPHRLDGQYDPRKRLAELEKQGIAAEVLFPDFGLPFELHPPLLAAVLGYTRTPEQIEVANSAYNRWLADFCATAPDRFVGLAVLSFADVERTISEIRWAKDAGLRGIVLPSVDEDTPFFDERFDPIWATLAELEMPANSHTAISAVTKHMATGTLKAVPHPACAAPLMTAQAYFSTQQILNHLIWGGVLERHPNLQLVMTEQGTGWVVSALKGMDYSWEASYLRRDVREIVKSKPSDYFRRQCHIGSSLFSRAEAEARYDIGVDKIAIGADYPHHEGTWAAGPGTVDYLRATLGVARVPAAEARMMLGGNALRLWKLDYPTLRLIADRIGPDLDLVLTPPTEEHFPRGDVHKPLATAF